MYDFFEESIFYPNGTAEDKTPRYIQQLNVRILIDTNSVLVEEVESYKNSLKRRAESAPDIEDIKMNAFLAIKSFDDALNVYLSGKPIEIVGQPLKNLNDISKSDIQNLNNAKIYTIEQLAKAQLYMLQNVGFGMQELQNKAKAFLKENNLENDAVNKISAENTQLKLAMQEMEQKLSILTAQMSKKEKVVSKTDAIPNLNLGAV